MKKGCNGLRAVSGELPFSIMARTATGVMDVGTVDTFVNSLISVAALSYTDRNRHGGNRKGGILKKKKKTKDDYQTQIMLISGGGSKG